LINGNGITNGDDIYQSIYLGNLVANTLVHGKPSTLFS
jgi:hypothetical protein